MRSGGGSQLAPALKGTAKSAFQIEARRGAKALHNHVCHALTDAMLKRIEHVPEGGNWRDIPRDLLPAGMRRARLSDHTKRYGRLARKGLASTILTKCDPHWGAYIHPTQNRTISVREAARLQGFPDTFVFAGEHLSKQYAQVGNAVPVPIAREIAKATLKQLLRIRKKPRPRRPKQIRRKADVKGQPKAGHSLFRRKSPLRTKLGSPSHRWAGVRVSIASRASLSANRARTSAKGGSSQGRASRPRRSLGR